MEGGQEGGGGGEGGGEFYLRFFFLLILLIIIPTERYCYCLDLILMLIIYIKKNSILPVLSNYFGFCLEGNCI